MIEYITPPHDFEMEQSLLGCLIADPEQFDIINAILPAAENTFYRINNQYIYKAMQELIKQHGTYDIPLIYSKVKQYTDEIGMSYLSEIEYPNGLLAEKYAKNIVSLYNARKIIEHCQLSIRNIQDGHDIMSVISNLRKNIDSTVIDVANIKPVNIADHAILVWEEYLDNQEKNVQSLITTGFIDLDRYINIKKSRHVLIGARTSMGKTSFALNLATNMALQGKRIMFFSMEQSKQDTTECYIAQLSDVSRDGFMRGKLSEREQNKVMENAHLWGSPEVMKMNIEDKTYSPMEVRHKLIMEMKDNPIDVVFIDFLHAMKPPAGYKRDGHEWLREATKQLEEIAIELNVAIITMVQLNRNVDNRENKRPVMTDIREAGEDHADIILFIYRDEYYNPNTEEPGIAEIIIAKQRHGPTGTIKLDFHNHSTAFMNRTQERKSWSVNYD